MNTIDVINDKIIVTTIDDIVPIAANSRHAPYIATSASLFDYCLYFLLFYTIFTVLLSFSTSVDQS